MRTRDHEAGEVMVNTVDLVLAGFSVLFFVGFIYWDAKLLRSINRGERIRLKRRDLNPLQNTFGFFLLAYLAFVLYLGTTFLFSLTANLILPLSGVGSPIILGMEAIGFLGLAFLLSLMNPRKKSTPPAA